MSLALLSTAVGLGAKGLSPLVLIAKLIKDPKKREKIRRNKALAIAFNTVLAFLLQHGVAKATSGHSVIGMTGSKIKNSIQSVLHEK